MTCFSKCLCCCFCWSLPLALLRVPWSIWSIASTRRTREKFTICRLSFLIRKLFFIYLFFKVQKIIYYGGISISYHILASRPYGYSWNQTVWDTTDNILSNTDFASSVHLGFQLQFCRNVSTLLYPAYCKTAAPASPVYVVRSPPPPPRAWASKITHFPAD